MATRNSKTSKTTKTGKRVGRPTNASKVAAIQSQQSLLIDRAMAAASAAAKAAIGIVDGGVTTIGASQTQSQSKPAKSASTAKKSPGRKADPDSALSQTKLFYAENLKAANPLNRADFVKAATAKFGYTKETGNTYVSNIEAAEGYKLVRRGGSTAARGRRGRKTAATAATGTNG